MSLEEDGLQKPCKRKGIESCDNQGSDDVQNDEEFLKAEEDIKNDLEADYQVFLDVPEVHPEYGTYHDMFMEQFSKRYGDDPVRCGELWEAFWAEIIKEKQESEWEIKRTVLIKQFQIQLRGYKAPAKKLKGTENHNVITSEVRDVKSTKAEGIDVSNECSTNNSRETSKCDCQVDSSFLQSLELLEEKSDVLGDIFGSVLKRVIKKTRELRDTKEITKFVENKDIKKLLVWAAGKLKHLSAVAVGSEKELLVQCSNTAQSLLEYSTESTREKYGGLDLRRVAEATFDKDIPIAFGIIKETLRFSGFPNPSEEFVSEVLGKVASLHLEMALAK